MEIRRTRSQKNKKISKIIKVGAFGKVSRCILIVVRSV